MLVLPKVGMAICVQVDFTILYPFATTNWPVRNLLLKGLKFSAKYPMARALAELFVEA